MQKSTFTWYLSNKMYNKNILIFTDYDKIGVRGILKQRRFHWETFLVSDRRKRSNFSDKSTRLDDWTNLFVAWTGFDSRLQRRCTSQFFRQRFVSRNRGCRFGRSLWKVALSKWSDKAFRHWHLCIRFLIVHCQHLRYPVTFFGPTMYLNQSWFVVSVTSLCEGGSPIV